MRFIPRFSITNAIAAALTEIERARGHWLVSDGGVPCRANPRPKPHS